MKEKLLTQDEVARVTGWTVRHIRRCLQSVPGAKGRNGRPQPMYPLSTIPAEARQKWLATFGWGAVDGGQQVTHEVLIGEDEVRRLCGGVIPPGAQPVYRPTAPSRPDSIGTPVAALPDRAVAALPDQLALELPAPVASSLSPADRAVADHRYQIIEPLIAPERHQALWRQFAGKGALVAFLAQQHKTPARTLYRWMQQWQARKLAGLVNRDRSDRGQSRVLTPAAQQYIAAALLPAPADPRNGKPGRSEMSIREVYRAYEEERAWRESHPDAGEPLSQASYESFRIWAAKIPRVVRDVAARGDQDYFNRHALVTWRDLEALDPLEYIVMDHRLADFFCLTRDPGKPWRLIRPWLTAAIDMRTRKWLAWVVCITPSSDSIAAVIKRAILDHGLLYRDGKCASTYYWDNGKDFRCEYLEGPEPLPLARPPRRTRSGRGSVGELPPAMRGVMDSLGARVKHALPMRPHSKIIEPNFLRLSNFDRTLPWWCGHKPQARPERFTRMVREHELWMKGKREQPSFVDDRGAAFTIEYAAWVYDEALVTLNQRPLEGRGMEKTTPQGRAWSSPDECWARLIGGVDRRSADPRLLQFAFHRRLPRPLTVRQGEVSPTFDGRQYHYRLRGDSQSLMLLDGRQVSFAYDRSDLGTAALYADDQFVGLADSIELSRMGEDSFIQDERDRRSALKTIRGFIAAIQTGDVAPVEERARRREAARAALPEGQVAGAPTGRMPMPQAIEQAAAAAAADANFSFSRGGATPAPPLSVSSTSEEVRPAPAAAIAQPPPAAGEISEDDGEFRFFGG